MSRTASARLWEKPTAPPEDPKLFAQRVLVQTVVPSQSRPHLRPNRRWRDIRVSFLRLFTRFQSPIWTRSTTFSRVLARVYVGFPEHARSYRRLERDSSRPLSKFDGIPTVDAGTLLGVGVSLESRVDACVRRTGSRSSAFRSLLVSRSRFLRFRFGHDLERERERVRTSLDARSREAFHI